MVKTWYVGILWYFTNLNWGHLGMISLINHEWGRSEVIVCHPDGIWAWSSHSHPTATAFGNQRVLGWRGDDLNPCGQNLGCSINGAIPKDYFMICHGKSQGIITGGTPMLGNTPRLKKLRNRCLFRILSGPLLFPAPHAARFTNITLESSFSRLSAYVLCRRSPSRP